MSIVELFTIFKDIFLAGSAVTMAYVAYRGLEKWKSELAGKADFDVARNLIRSVYKLRNEIQSCRSLFVSAGEFPEGYRNGMAGLTNREKGDAWLYVYNNRWNPVFNAIQEFDVSTLEVEALWGRDAKEKTQALRQLAMRLRVAIDSFLRNEYSGNQDLANSDFDVRVRSDLNASGLKGDSLSPAIDSAIEEIEIMIRPHLKRDY
ncbi:hypothetical protein [Hahella sp. NBU794]|uniref:hypothetical protein n=1 Tax=Hahella sp. NBU794 TaxID=3422590 RepID=UPI003D6E9FF9